MAQAETEQLTRITLGAALSRAVCTIAELGLANQIEAGSPRSVASLASATGTHEPSLYRILRFLASHGIFQEKDNRQFDHTPLSHCLRTDAEGSFRAAGRMIHRLFPAWDGLHHAALTGEPAFNKIFKQPLFDYVGTHPELAPIFDAGMTAFHGHETGAMLEAYNFTAIQVLADIGGGNGSLIGSVLRRYPIPNNGRLLVIESVVPTGDEPSLAKDFDIAMLTFPGGIERTAEEYKLLLEKAGFRLSSITPTASSVSVIEGKPR